MRPRERWRIYRQILDQLWDGRSKVSYASFVERLEERRQRLSRKHRRTLPVPSAATFSRLWQGFTDAKGLRRLPRRSLRRLLLDGVTEGAWDVDASPEDVYPLAIAYLGSRRIVPPVHRELLRQLRTVQWRAQRRRRAHRDRLLARALGTVLSSCPLARRFRVAQKILRFPPAARGKVGLPKLVLEDAIRRRIEKALRDNRLDLATLLAQPDLDEAFDFVERRPASTLQRWERREVVRAIPMYLAARHRQAVDALLFTFMRLARLLRLRVQNSFDERLVQSNHALFERRAGELAALRHAVLVALTSGDPSGLRPFRRLLSSLEEQGEAVQTRRGYYLLLASRGTFARKLTRRLQGIAFEGGDAHARAVVSAFAEVLRFSPFAERVPRAIRRRLHFLDVPPAQMAQRRVFETIVLITLADLLWLGRVTSPDSQRFGNRWTAVRAAAEPPDLASVRAAIHRARQRLHDAWAWLEDPATRSSVVVDGRLVAHRPSRKRLLEEERQLQRAKQRFLAARRPVSIVEVLQAVDRATGMLGGFRPPKAARRRHGEDQRRRLALAVVLARGMNIGVAQMATLLGRWYTVGRLTNFDETYATVANLRRANKIILDCWDQRWLGVHWGPGKGVAADGRSIQASERNLLAGYHYRHRRTGVTLYWLVRDDWMAAKVGVIGNHEWESWYLLDGLLGPIGGRPPHWATGDTHGQHLALWGLSFLLGKEIRARFRRLSHVKLYHDGPVGRLPIRGVQRVRWWLVARALPSLAKLVAAIRERRISGREVLRTWNLYDDDGTDVTEALRELGKVVRTRFVLRYATSEKLRRQIREGCNRAETWNSFQQAVFWGHGGRMQTNDSRRQEVNALCMMLIMNSTVFYNEERHGLKLRRIDGASPATWEHIRMLGDYRITLSRRTVGGEAQK